jgi:hypothetical protein
LKPVAEEAEVVEAVEGAFPEEVLPAVEDFRHDPAGKQAAENRAERYQKATRNDVIKQRIRGRAPGEINGAARKIVREPGTGARRTFRKTVRNGRIRTGKIFRTKDAIVRKTDRISSKMSMMIIGMTVVLFTLVLRSVLQLLERQPI